MLLADLLAEVQPKAQIDQVSSGYFLQDDLLVRKWLPFSGEGLDEDV